MEKEPQNIASADDSGLLSKKEAHQEYLMMRTALGLNKNGELTKLNEESGEFEKIKPTKEDFDEAYEKVSELIRLAEEEPKTKKFLFALGRTLNTTTAVSAKIITQIFAASTRLLFPLGDEDRTKEAWDNIDEVHDNFKKQLVDAQQTLDKYRKSAEQSAIYQNQ